MRSMIKHLSLAAAVLLLLAGCGNDNSGNTMETGTTDLVPTSAVCEGCDELAGGKYSTFSLPDRIIIPQPEEICELEVRARQSSDVEAEGQKLFRSLIGEDFKQENCGWDDFQYFYSCNGEHCSAQFTGNILTFSSDRHIAGELSSENLSVCWDAETEPDKAVPLGSGTVTVKELSDAAEKYLRDTIGFLVPDLEIRVQDIFPFSINNEDRARIVSALYYKGIPIEDYISPTVESSENEIRSYYNCMTDMIMTEADECIFLSTTIPEITSKTSQENIIGFRDAVKILDDTLAEYLSYSFEDVELMYSCLMTQPVIDVKGGDYEAAKAATEAFEAEPKKLHPTWCFILDNNLSGFSRQLIKLDAVTGEVTVNIRY